MTTVTSSLTKGGKRKKPFMKHEKEPGEEKKHMSSGDCTISGSRSRKKRKKKKKEVGARFRGVLEVKREKKEADRAHLLAAKKKRKNDLPGTARGRTACREKKKGGGNGEGRPAIHGQRSFVVPQKERERKKGLSTGVLFHTYV